MKEDNNEPESPTDVLPKTGNVILVKRHCTDVVLDKLLDLVHVQCCVCKTDDADPVGKGKDFEYNTSTDTFLAMRCNAGDLSYLNSRPDIFLFDRILGHHPPIPDIRIAIQSFQI